MNLMFSPTMFLTSSILITSTAMALSSSNWIFLWAAMELNMLSFVPIMMQTKTNQESEGAVKYFLAQALGSAILLMTSTAMWMPFTSVPNIMPIMLTVATLLKLGAVPCHFWYPSVMKSISWMSCLILSTWQKLAPLSILAFLIPNKSALFITAVGGLNALVGGVMGMNQSQLRAIMAYSSIGHIGWMLSLTAIYKPYASIMYFMIYSIMIMPLFMLMWFFNLNSSKQTSKLATLSVPIQLTIIMLLLSLGGLPPLTGFAPKLMTVMLLTNEMSITTMLLIMGSVMNLFFYLNIVINTMLSSPNDAPKKIDKNKTNPMILTLAIMSLGMSPLIMLYAMTLFYQP